MDVLEYLTVPALLMAALEIAKLVLRIFIMVIMVIRTCTRDMVITRGNQLPVVVPSFKLGWG